MLIFVFFFSYLLAVVTVARHFRIRLLGFVYTILDESKSFFTLGRLFRLRVKYSVIRRGNFVVNL